ncbi:hypothetical protein BY996DRAFT_6467968 [Phakopsora pachyrhizi]|nr:hypothetical protein BY996DRAFT_6467968 [Phakopsora pachyrhizi]
MSLEMEFPKVLRSKRHMPTDLFKRLDSCQEIIDSISAKHPFEECKQIVQSKSNSSNAEHIEIVANEVDLSRGSLGTLNLDLVKIKIDLYHPTNTSHQNWQYSSVSADCRFVEFKGGSRNDLAEIRLMLEDVVKSVVDGKSQIEDQNLNRFYWGAKEGKQARQIDKQNEVNKVLKQGMEIVKEEGKSGWPLQDICMRGKMGGLAKEKSSPSKAIDGADEVDKRTEEQRIQDKQDRGAENSEVRIKRTIRGEALVLRSHQ